jgi:hypothetical protein
MLENTIPIKIPKHNFKNIAEARSWAKENIVGTYRNANINEDISISRQTIDKCLSESAVKKSVDLDIHLSTLKKLPQLIENSVLAERHPDRDGDSHIREIQRLYSTIDYEGKIFPVKITVKATFNDGNKAYSYEVIKIESPTENLSGNSNQSAPESGSQSSNNPDISTIVRDLRTSETGLSVSKNGATDFDHKDINISENTKGDEKNYPI